MDKPRVASDASVSALLGALAGFLASENAVFSASDAFDGGRTLAFLVAYATLFTLPAFIAWTIRVWRAGQRAARKALAVLSATYLTAYFFLALAMVSAEASQGNRLTFVINDVYGFPTLALPLIWLIVVTLDGGGPVNPEAQKA